jgi:serine phosphatase RsbU (regulator of sigma subunit)
MLSPFHFTGLVNFLTAFGISILIFYKKKHLKWFIFLNLSVAFWSLFYFIWHLSINAALASILIKFVFAGMVLVPIGFFHFCSETSHEKPNKVLTVINWGVASFFIIANFTTKLVITGISPIGYFELWPKAGILFPFYLLFFVLNAAYGHWVLIKTYSFNKKVVWIFIATLIGFSGAATNFFYFYNINIPPFGNILVSLYVSMMAYAIISPRAMELSLVFSKSLANLIALAFILTPYVFIQIMIRGVFGKISMQWIVINLAFFSLMAPFFSKIKNRIKRFSHSILIDEYYDHKEAFQNILEAFDNSHNSIELAQTLKQYLQMYTKATWVEFFIRDELSSSKKPEYIIINGIKKKGHLTDIDNILINVMEKTGAQIIYEDASNNIKNILNKMQNCRVCIPCFSVNSLVAVILLGKPQRQEYQHEDRALFDVLGAQVGAILNRVRVYDYMKDEYDKKKQIEKELTMARDIQRKLLPEYLPNITNYKFKAAFVPAKEISGDYYQFIPFSEDEIGILISDISGKGVVASYVMFVVHAVISKYLDSKDSPKEAMMKLNKIICEERAIEKFVPMFYAKLNTKTNTLTYCSAGHDPQIHISGKNIELLESTGFPLGGFEDAEYEESTVKIKDGDSVVLYTDGLTDAVGNDGKKYEFDRVQAICTTHLSAGGFGESVFKLIMDDWLNFTKNGGVQADDLTVISIEYKKVKFLK